MEGRGRGGLNKEGGLINFPPPKRGGGVIREGGLNRGFMVCVLCVKFYGRIFPKTRHKNEQKNH